MPSEKDDNICPVCEKRMCVCKDDNGRTYLVCKKDGETKEIS